MFQASDRDLLFDDFTSTMTIFFQFNEDALKAEWDKNSNPHLLGSEFYSLSKNTISLDNAGGAVAVTFDVDMYLFMTKR